MIDLYFSQKPLLLFLFYCLSELSVITWFRYGLVGNIYQDLYSLLARNLWGFCVYELIFSSLFDPYRFAFMESFSACTYRTLFGGPHPFIFFSFRLGGSQRFDFILLFGSYPHFSGALFIQLWLSYLGTLI